MSKPLILITNDDGVFSKGISELIKLARPLGEILVVAPDKARSGQSSALTVTRPLLYDDIQVEDGLRIISCTGTPADCVKLAFSQQLPDVERVPDLVLSGINHGSNSSINVIYSGTMGAAIEGALHRAPSIGLSLCDHSYDADFSQALPHFRHIVERVLAWSLPQGVCLNVNAPVGEIKGIKVCRQAPGLWSNEFMKTLTPFDKHCFWLTGSFSNEEPGAVDTDEWALGEGFISVQPVQTDLTDYNLLKTLTF